jgi:hypothetical protein
MPLASKSFFVYLQVFTCLQFAEANAAAVATAHEGYVLANMMEEKTVELERRVVETANALEMVSSTSTSWEQNARDAGAKLESEHIVAGEAKNKYTALEAVLWDSCQKALGEFVSFKLSSRVPEHVFVFAEFFFPQRSLL